MNLAKLQEQRAKRLAKTKALAEGESFEYLNLTNLPKGNAGMFWPRETEEFVCRIVPFEVTKPNNIGGDEVGDYVTCRKIFIHMHVGAADKTEICPRTYGYDCPLCDHFMSFPEDVRKDRKGPAIRFKPKQMALFNAIFKEANEAGKTLLKVRVIRGGAFASIGKILDAIKIEAEFENDRAKKANRASKADEVFLYDDIELGYYMTVRAAKATAVAGGSKDSAFMQFINVDVNEWKQPKKMVPEQAFALIADLDLLIPEPLGYEALAKLAGLGESRQPTYADTTAGDVPEVGGDEEDGFVFEEDDKQAGDAPEGEIVEAELADIPEDVPTTAPKAAAKPAAPAATPADITGSAPPQITRRSTSSTTTKPQTASKTKAAPAPAPAPEVQEPATADAIESDGFGGDEDEFADL